MYAWASLCSPEAQSRAWAVFPRRLCDMVAAVGSTNATDTRYREMSDETLVETEEFVITDK